MSTPACYGSEFAVNANNCLTMASIPTKAWPYAATCNLADTNGLRRDAVQGLWTWPRTPRIYINRTRASAPITITGAGFFGQNWATAMAGPACYGEQMLLSVAVCATVELYTDTYATLRVWAGQNADPGYSGYRAVDTRWSNNEAPAFKATMNTVFPRRVRLAANTVSSVKWGFALEMAQRAGATVTWGRITDWSVNVTAMVYPTTNPASDG